VHTRSSPIPFEDVRERVLPQPAPQVFPNCPRYIDKMQRVEPSKFVPQPTIKTLIPCWKRTMWARDALPAGDPARLRKAPDEAAALRRI